MSLKIYNTLTGKRELFIPTDPKCVQLYTCGPSVYDTPHLGNYRTFVYEDLLKRVLTYKGYKVRHVMNITDLETKGILASKREGVDFWKLMGENTKLFFQGVEEFRLIPADVYPRASESVQGMANAVKEMMRKGYAYKYNGDVYFDVSKASGYGELSHYRFDKKLLSGRVRLHDYNQGEAGDFILWYHYRKSHGKIFWNTALGRGMPSWNAECPVLCSKFLNLPMDIHAGGHDNIFSHHENEIAQIRALTGKMPARYWFHVRHLMVNGRKMSKTLKNYHSVEQLKKMGFSVPAIKWLLLSKPYTHKANFTIGNLRKYEKLYRCFRHTMRSIKGTKRCLSREHFCPVTVEKGIMFFEALDDCLDFPRAFEHAMKLVVEAEKRRKSGRLCKGCMKEFVATMREFDRATGAFPF